MANIPVKQQKRHNHRLRVFLHKTSFFCRKLLFRQGKIIEIIKSNYYIRMAITFELFTPCRWSGNQNQSDMRTIY